MTRARPPFPSHLNTVQALRGIAAILVLLLHTVGMQRAIAEPQFTKTFYGFWDRGFAGVDMFFVISGFIMVYVTRETSKGAGSAWQFLKARFVRIYPLWWFYAGLMALIYYLIYDIPARPEYASASGGVTSYILKSFLLLPQNSLPVIDLGWTLTFEMYYYLVFAFILLLPRRILPIAMVFWIFQILIFQFLTPNSPVLNVLKSPLSLEFIGGAFMALLVLGGLNVKPGLVLCLGCLGFGFSLLLPLAESNLWGGWGRVILFGLPSMAIIYGLVTLEYIRNIQSPRWLHALGNWSYSLYLGHIIVLLVMKNIWEILEKVGLPQALKLGTPGPLDDTVFVLASIGAAVFTAMLSYFIVERPLLKLLRPSRRTP